MRFLVISALFVQILAGPLKDDSSRDLIEAMYLNKKLQFHTTVTSANIALETAINDLNDKPDLKPNFDALRLACTRNNPINLMTIVNTDFLKSEERNYLNLHLLESEFQLKNFEDFKKELLNEALKLLEATKFCKEHLKDLKLMSDGKEDVKTAQDLYQEIALKLDIGTRLQKDLYWPEHVQRDAQSFQSFNLQSFLNSNEGEELYKHLMESFGDGTGKIDFAVVTLSKTNNTQWSEPVVFKAGSATDVVSYDTSKNSTVYVYRSQAKANETAATINEKRMKTFREISDSLVKLVRKQCLADITNVLDLFQSVFKELFTSKSYPFMLFNANSVKNDPNWSGFTDENFNGAILPFSVNVQMCPDKTESVPLFFNVFAAY
ncbi:hypothetical protein L596_029517 [Steinernema carpocapsae]|uniref:Uncharacterized protein n=1 Tax=Steinernema carpocapsae TaxID=34508 RepID=A0A4U5LUV9_STECR|nr:hypothetical protein L596_029517 [Steinernema carpocapsae]